MADDYYHKLVADPIWFLGWTVFASSIGFIAGHRLALSRDRRIEFNQAAERLFPVIRHEIVHASPASDDVSSESAIFRRHLSKFSKWRFDKLLSRYKAACHSAKKRDSTGSSYYEDTSDIVAALQDMLAFTNRR